MSNKIRMIVKMCDICQNAKKLRKTHAGRGGFLLAGYPWQTVGVDIMGPFPETSRGNKWILVLTDHFSRWQDAFSIVDVTAETVATALDTLVFSYLGIPEIIHSDRGKQFESALTQ